jgi:hypothetical protein
MAMTERGVAVCCSPCSTVIVTLEPPVPLAH